MTYDQATFQLVHGCGAFLAHALGEPGEPICLHVYHHQDGRRWLLENGTTAETANSWTFSQSHQP